MSTFKIIQYRRMIIDFPEYLTEIPSLDVTAMVEIIDIRPEYQSKV